MEGKRYMKENIVILSEELKEKPTLDTWRLLAELTASRLTISNRRRGNEIMNLLLSRYQERDKFKASEVDEIRKSLTALEERLMLR